MTRFSKSTKTRLLVLTHVAVVAALCLFVSAPMAHAACSGCTLQIYEGTDNAGNFFGGDDGTGGVDGPCYSYTSYACIVVAAFNANSYTYYYKISGGSSNGISGLGVFFRVNGVNEGSYTTTSNSNNPGTFVVVGTLNSTYTFLGVQYFGNDSCANGDYYYFGPTVTEAFGGVGGYIYGVGIPYRGSSCPA